MAVLWAEDGTVGQWVASPLRGRQHELALAGAEDSGERRQRASGAKLLRCIEPDDQWVLVSSPTSGVRVNGAPLVLGIRVMRHRDEIVLPSIASGPRRWFFSGECVVEVRPLPEEYAPATCPHCKRRIAVDSPAVQCPNTNCGAWYHETPELPCWSSREYCDLCETPAVLGAGTRWSPEEL